MDNREHVARAVFPFIANRMGWHHVFDDHPEKNKQLAYDCAEAAIAALEAQFRAANALAELVEGIIEGGCPSCGGDCSSANPPPGYCPQKEAMKDLATYRATRLAANG